MSIVVYPDVILPNRVIDAGVRGKQVRRNSRVTTDSGLTAINIVWTQTLREYEVGFIPMLREAWQDIETIHEITEGGAYGFLMEDPKDHRVDRGVAYEVSAGVYQLYKRYLETASGRYKDRKITRPRAASFSIAVSDVAVGGADYELDDETGLVTIDSAPDAADITWTGLVYVPVHFMDDMIDWQMIAPGQNPDIRYISGPTTVLQEIRE